MVVLGFAIPIDKNDALPTSPSKFASKLGGLPVWLHHHLPLPLQTCQTCSSKLSFLLQLYTTEDFPLNAYHRVVYIYYCQKKNCKTFKVWRSQVPKEYRRDELEGKCCFVCGLEGVKCCGKCKDVYYCSRVCQILHWNGGGELAHKVKCGEVEKMVVQVVDVDDQVVDPILEDWKCKTFNLAKVYEIVSEPEPSEIPNLKNFDLEPSEIPNLKNFDLDSIPLVNNDSIAFKNLDISDLQKTTEEEFNINNLETETKEMKLNNIENPEIDEDEQMEETSAPVDSQFLKFQKRIERAPDQILRYYRTSYNTTTLKNNIVYPSLTKEGVIKECSDCGGEMRAEMQIMPHVISLLGWETVDFGSLVVFSCEGSCEAGSYGWKEEVGVRLDFSEEGMRKFQ